MNARRLVFAFLSTVLCAGMVMATQPVHATAKKPQPDRMRLNKLPSGEEVTFDYFPSGPIAQVVRNHWKTHPEYGKYWDKLQLLPEHAIGLADLNGDKKLEVFVRLTSYENYCDQAGFACRLVIYAYTTKGLVEIGNFMAADPVIILPQKTKGINNLYAADSKDISRFYVWDGRKYVRR